MGSNLMRQYFLLAILGGSWLSLLLGISLQAQTEMPRNNDALKIKRDLHTGWVRKAVFSPAGPHIMAVSSRYQRVTIYDLRDDRIIRKIDVDPEFVEPL